MCGVVVVLTRSAPAITDPDPQPGGTRSRVMGAPQPGQLRSHGGTDHWLDGSLAARVARAVEPDWQT